MIVGLLGGNELGAGSRDFDQALAEASGANEVCIVGTAAAAQRGLDIALAHARRHFRGLGLDTADSGLHRRSDASRAEVAERLRGARLVYLLGGDPGRLLDALLGTRAWAAMLDVLHAGGAVAGSSAGAMVLAGAVLLRSRDPRPARRHAREGLGLLRDCAVIPHANRFAAGWLEAAHRAAPGADVLGLDEETGAIHTGGRGWVVYGPGEVRLWRHGAVPARSRRAGETLDWRAPAFQRPPKVV